MAKLRVRKWLVTADVCFPASDIFSTSLLSKLMLAGKYLINMLSKGL